MAADLRERVARTLCRENEGTDQSWPGYLTAADAVLAELGLTQAESVGEVVHWGDDGVLLYRGRDSMPPGTKLYAALQPQPSAEDVALVGVAIKEHAARYPGSATEAAWQRIRADYERMGVVK
jgi:hypothetical protein